MATQSSQYSGASVVRIEASKGWFALRLHEVWSHRELLYYLTWRDLKVRYKQTALGALWAVIQPLMTMVIFTVVFGTFAKIPSDGLPYPIFVYSALLPWTFFSSALNRCVGSIVGQANIISKVYFPRLIVPLSATLSGFVDFAISFVILVGMMFWFGIVPGWQILLLPLFIGLALLTAFGVGLWFASFNVKYRDIGHGVPFLVQLWMYATPVVYPVSLVPERWRALYKLNPMVGVIEGFRWALLGKESPDFGALALSASAVLAVTVGGLVYFKRTERTMVDVI